ncbi:MAG: tetratricopeptide repeat protein [Mangrovibacterium sp.]
MKGVLYKLIVLFALILAGINVWAQSSKIDSLNNLLSGQKGEELARTYLELSRAWSYIDPTKMIAFADKALSIAREAGNLKQECYGNLLYGTGKLLAGDFEEGKPYIDVGLEQARKLNSQEYLCIGLNSLAIYHMNGGNYDLAFKLFHETLEMAESANLSELAANSRFNLGTILTSRGDRTDGLKYLLQALAYYESRKEQRLIARIYNNIAVNYHSWKDYNQALHYYRKTLASYLKLNDFVGLAAVSNNIGEIYKDKNEFEKAIPYYQRTIHIADSTGIGEYYKSYGWVGLAETYLLMKEYDLSLQNVNLALKAFERIKMQEGISQAKLILAQIYLHHKRYRESIQAVDSALKLAETMGIIRMQKMAYQVKATIYADQKRYKEAFDMLNFVVQENDSLYREEQLKELTRLRGELNISEKNKEIQLLLKNNEIKDLKIKKQRTQTKYLVALLGLLVALFIIMLVYIRSRKQISLQMQEKNQRINDQRLELIKVNATKDKFLSIIGHDLRNPVGAFRDVIGQLADFPEMFPDETRQQVIKELRDEAERTYFLLENLLSWAKNQKNNISYRPEKLDLASLIDNNILLNSRSAERKQIRLKSNVPAGVNIFADHNMANLILRNLISNAIKFTFQNGEVTISAKDTGDFIEISVADNGIGIAEENRPYLFQEINHISTYGTNNEKGSGIGLVLCREFIEMNGGTITVSSKKNEGSTFTFTLLKYKAVQFN